MSTPERFHFKSTDGLSIACVKWSGQHEPRGVIQISQTNLIIIGVMILLFVLALVVPFPSGHGDHPDEQGRGR